MPETWPCPHCGTDVPDPGVRRDPQGASRQTCPGCGSGLTRDPDGPEPAWRLDPEHHMGGG